MKKTFLLFSDVIILYGSLILALLIRYPRDFSGQFELHGTPFAFIFILWILVFYISNLYEPSGLRNTVSFYTTLFRSMSIGAVLSIAFFYLIPYFGITPKTNLFIFLVIFALAETANRSFFNRVIEKRFHRRVAIVGMNAQAVELALFLKDNPQMGYELRYLVDIGPLPLESAGNELQTFSIVQGTPAIQRAIKQHEIDTVVISPEAYQMPDIIAIFYQSLEHKVQFYNLASFSEKVTGKVPLGAINQIWFLENLNEGQKKTYETIKRGMDIAGAILLGIPTLLITPLIAAAIKLTSPGPVLYRQQRVGNGRKIFTIRKFRTMIVNDPFGGAEGKTGPVWAQENDPRIITIGGFLRKTRINELPQLWNVFKGEMSFVGPRAERPEFHEMLKREIPFYEERYLIKPGLTGLSQLYFGYGASVKDAEEKLRYDLYYIKNRSLALDASILLKTIGTVLRAGGR